jgi:hypothetical protein
MYSTVLRAFLFILVAATLISAVLASAQVSVVTYHNDNARTGQNLGEVTLTPSNVSTNFGKLFTNVVDDWVIAQPLYVPNVSIGGGTHNVVYIATLNNSLYAMDADTSATIYWQQNYGAPTPFAGICTDTKYQNAAHGGAGIVSTPVIDTNLGNIYFATKTGNGTVASPYAMTFYAVNISTGNTVASTTINPGTSDWNPHLQMSRPALAEDPTGSYIYVGLGATGCQNYKYEHGFVVAYSTTTAALVGGFATTVGTSNNGGIWQGGGGLNIDANGDIYFETADANYNGKTSFGDSVMKINTGANNLGLLDWFTPYNQSTLLKYDLDLSSSGPILLPDQTVGPTHLLVATGKTEEIYLINRDNMGKFVAGANTNIVQDIPTMSSQTGCLTATIGSSTGSTCRNGSPSFFSSGTNSYVYMIDDGNSTPASLSFPCDVLQYTLSNGLLSTTPTAQTTFGTNCLVGSPSISANGSTNAIVWVVISKGTATALHALDPSTLATLYNSQQHQTRDALGNTARFVTPTIANGKVYVGGKTPTGGDVVVYGLLNGKGAAQPSGGSR